MDFKSILFFSSDNEILSVFFWLCIIILFYSLTRTCVFASMLKHDVNNYINGRESSSQNRLSTILSDYLATLSSNKRTSEFASDFFCLDSVSQSYKYNLKLRNVTPNILTSLGILGTFVGLSMSLTNFDSESSEGIKNSIQTLLGGMNTAFVTSVIGMGCSIILLIVERYSHNNNVRRINTLCSFLDRQYYCSSDEMVIDSISLVDENGIKIKPADSLVSIQESVNKMRKQLETFGVDICDSIGNALDSSFQEKLVPILNDLSQKLENPAQAVTDSLITELRNVCNDFSMNMTQGLNDKMDELMERFIDASNSIQTLPDTIDLATKGLNISTQDTILAVQALSEAMGKQLGQLNELSIGFAESLTKLSESASAISVLHAKLVDIPDAIKSASDSVVMTVGEVKEIQNSVNDTMATVKNVNDITVNTINEFSDNVHNIEKGLSGIFSEINEGVNQYSESVKNSLDGMLSPFTTSVADATERVANAIAPLNDAVTDLGNFNDSVRILLKEIDNSFKPIESVLEQLADIQQKASSQIDVTNKK